MLLLQTALTSGELRCQQSLCMCLQLAQVHIENSVLDIDMQDVISQQMYVNYKLTMES